MKKALIVLLSLMIVFSGSWILKDKTPKVRPFESAVNAAETWWDTDPNQTPDTSSDWTLDPEIPDNYVPVPGEDELYMEIDPDGKIKAYRHRVKQSDGSWVWETVNPDIPAGYEPVEGLENVYKVIDEDGNVTYVKYIRNDDDTFAFVPCDSNGKIIDVKAKDNDDGIPSNYVRVSGNIFAVYDENGVLIGYKERIKNGDGTYNWIDAEKPTKESKQDSEISQSSDLSVPDVSLSEQSRQSRPSSQGGGTNTNADQHQNSTPTTPTQPSTSTPSTSVPESSQSNESSSPEVVIVPGQSSVPDKKKENYTTTDTYTTTETSGGWRITYETTVYKTYDGNGVLLATKKIGPTEVKREKIGASDTKSPDRSRIESTLDKELIRVSSGVTFNDSLATEVLNQLNAERTAQGKPTLKMSTSSNAYKVARLLAADMATYDHSDYDSPMYGTLRELLDRYNISAGNPSENVWKATQKTAQQIHSRLQAENNTVRMSESYSEVGIAITVNNGYYYICEIYL